VVLTTEPAEPHKRCYKCGESKPLTEYHRDRRRPDGRQAKCLEGGYPLITAALRSGSGICGAGFASELLTWSGSGYSEVC